LSIRLPTPRRVLRSRAARLALLAAAVALAWAIATGAGRGGARASAAGAGEPVPQTDASVPAARVTMIGASPEEAGAPGGAEAWGVGFEGATAVTVRYYEQGGGAGTWTLGPSLPPCS
jgi:hypothetical protein